MMFGEQHDLRIRLHRIWHDQTRCRRLCYSRSNAWPVKRKVRPFSVTVRTT